MSILQDTDAKFQAYLALLKKWQPKINLISNNTLDDAWERHFQDSLQLLEILPQGEQVIYDFGSGAGFPGLVLAMARSEIKMHLVESDQKKCTFMKTVSRETNTPVQIHNRRIENVSRETNEIDQPDIIIARALASLVKLFDYCSDWIDTNPDLILIFPKGEHADDELSELEQIWHYDCRTFDSKTSENAKVLVFSNAYRM